ncbi:hypothetical protein TcasGA2_TC010802 [Tribolium castaneum]|uniref:Uncharacterized protein n=1 Tax=Tribolium castaneum TaxID=7070 RepID=D6W7K5_TRICA|nr:hypothetical protein TcasGA2_TC010802 [Tribolium castaneum]
MEWIQPLYPARRKTRGRSLYSYFGVRALDNTCLKRVIFGGELRDFLLHLGEDTGIYV